MTGYFGFQPMDERTQDTKNKHEAARLLKELDHYGILNPKQVSLIEKAIEDDEFKVSCTKALHKKNGRYFSFDIHIEKIVE